MDKYLVVYKKTKNNYSAYSPDIPGCVATGRDRDDVEKNMKEAIQFHLEGLKHDGYDAPKPSSSVSYIEV